MSMFEHAILGLRISTDWFSNRPERISAVLQGPVKTRFGCVIRGECMTMFKYCQRLLRTNKYYELLR